MINPADTKIGNERFLSGVQKKRPEKQIHFELQNTFERPFLLSPKGKTFHGESNKQIKLKPGMCVPFVATQSPRVFPRATDKSLPQLSFWKNEKGEDMQ